MAFLCQTRGVLVGVHDPLPAFRLGMAAALSDAGYEPVLVGTPELRPPTATLRRLLLSLTDAAAWDTLRAVRAAAPQVGVVALLEPATNDGYRDALRFGAVSVLPRAAPPLAIVAALRAADAQGSLVPTSVLVALVTQEPDGRPLLGEAEVRWLRALSRGLNVQQLAWREGWSQRSMYRRLSDVYRKLGVRTRGQALVRATELHLLDR